MENKTNDFDDFEDDPQNQLFDDCPNCKREYDEIDREYQICHFCGFSRNSKPPATC